MNSKKFIYILTIIFVLNLNLAAIDFEEIRTSQTFLYYRPAYFNLPARHSLWSQMFYEKSYSCKGVFQFVPIYQESIKNKNKHLARYFLLNCKSEIVIAGDSYITDPQNLLLSNQVRDVRAEWFGLPSNFNGILSLNPEQEQLAFIFNFNQDIKNWTNIEYFKKFWLDLSIPVLRVKNNINPQVKIINNSGNSPELINVLENIPVNAKITPKTLENTEIAEIKLTLGTRWFIDNSFFLATYGSLIAPASSCATPKYLFNSVIGPNGHWGMATGVRAELPLFNTSYNNSNYENCNFKTWIFLDIENQNFFTDKRCRVFDLKSKQWSRYLQYRRPGQTNTVTGTEILTLNSWVSPHNMLDLTTGLMLRYKFIETQVGYSLWARQRETVKLVRPVCSETGFAFEHFGIAGQTPGSSASKSTISTQAPEDSEFKFLNERDIDLCSGSYPGGSSNRIHAFIGFNTFECYNNSSNNRFYFGAVGAFYEWAHTNSTLTNWGVWLKFGSSF